MAGVTTHGLCHPKTIVGNRWAGYDTIENWCKRLGMTKSGLSSRLIRIGTEDIRSFDRPHPRCNRNGRHGIRTVDPFTGIEDSIKGHARRLGVDESTFKRRLNDKGLRPEFVWLQDIEHTPPMEFDTRRAKLVFNPFTGRGMYKNEWAEMLNMTINSFSARMKSWGIHDRRTWEVCKTPHYSVRTQARKRRKS